MRRKIAAALLAGAMSLLPAQKARPEDGSELGSTPGRTRESIIEAIYSSPSTMPGTQYRLRSAVIPTLPERIAKAAREQTTSLPDFLKIDLKGYSRNKVAPSAQPYRSQESQATRPAESATISIRNENAWIRAKHNWKTGHGEFISGFDAGRGSLEVIAKSPEDIVAKSSIALSGSLRIRTGYDFSSQSRIHGLSISHGSTYATYERSFGQDGNTRHYGLVQAFLPEKFPIGTIYAEHCSTKNHDYKWSSTKINVDRSFNQRQAPISLIHFEYALINENGSPKRSSSASLKKHLGPFTISVWADKKQWMPKSKPGFSVAYTRTF